VLAASGVAVADDWQVGDAGLRGLEDGQPVGVKALSGLFPTATVLERNKEQFEIRVPGRTTPAPVTGVDAEVIAVVSTGSLTSLVAYGPEVRASSGLGVGSTIAELAAAVPELECARWDPDIACSSPYGRFSFFARATTVTAALPSDLSTATDFVVTWWSWTGSGRAKSAAAAPMKEWKAERGGIGPIDRTTRPTKANVASVLRNLTVVEQPDGKSAGFLIVKKGKSPLFWLRVLNDHIITLSITSAKFPTLTGVRVGDTLDTVRTKEPGLACVHTWSRGPSGGMHAVTCAGDGVEYWFATEHVTGNEPFVVPPPVDLDASKDLVVDQIHVELQ
jgi:hypothetical protein